MLLAMCSTRGSIDDCIVAAVAREALDREAISIARESLVVRKKKARRMNDAPSNKTYGNCLLGLHCSQKGPRANRAVAGFLVVAACQHGKLSTGY